MLRAVRRGVVLIASRASRIEVLRADLLTSCGVRGGVSVEVQCAPTVTGVRLFSPPPPPPSDAVPVMEELVTHRVREKLQGELRQDRTELLNKIDAAMKSLNDKVGGVEKSLNDKVGGVEKSVNDKINVNFQALHTKIDSTKVDISVRAAGYALFASTVAVSALGFVLETKVAVVDAKKPG